MTKGEELVKKGKNLKDGECVDVEIDGKQNQKVTLQMCRTGKTLVLKPKKQESNDG